MTEHRITTDPTDEEVETLARDIYLERYAKEGGRWELVETRDVWRDFARQRFAMDEGTRRKV